MKVDMLDLVMFKAKGMAGIQMPSTSLTPHVKKISIAAKAPPSY
jgi:hypothetical protein